MQNFIRDVCAYRRRALLASAVAVIAFGWLIGAAAQEVSAGTLAAAIRSSGHPCQRVIESSSEGASVYRVKCNAGWYKVTMKGDSATEVVPLD